MNTLDSWHETTLFGQLGENDRKLVAGLGTPRHFQPGEKVIAQGSTPDSVFLMLSGSAKVVIDPEGTLVELRLAGDLVGELTALDGHTRVGSVVASTPIQAKEIDSNELRRFLEHHPSVAMALLEVNARRWRWSFHRRADFSAHDVRTRVLRVLDQMAPNCLNRRDNELEVPLCQEELAQLAGAGKRTTQLVLKELHELGALRQGYRKIYITDLAALHQVATHPDRPQLAASSPRSTR